MKKGPFVLLLVLVLLAAGSALAGEIVVPMNLITEQGVGKAIGTLTLKDIPGGLELVPMLSDLAPGTHGFHVHEKPDCGPGMKDGKPGAGLAAGGHYDP